MLAAAAFAKNGAMQYRASQSGAVMSFEVGQMCLVQRIVDLQLAPRRDMAVLGARPGALVRAILIAAAVLTLEAAVPAPAANDVPQHFAPMTFDIPSQPLAAALQTYSKVTGMQLLYESQAAGDRLSVAVEGEFTRDAALRVLLANSDLLIRYTQSNSITLVPLAADPDTPPAAIFGQADLALDTLHVRRPRSGSDPSQLRTYSGIIQSDVQQALRKEARTRNGIYSAGIKLWIDNPRTVRRTELFRSSGDRDRDETIARLLDGMQVSQAPPLNTPQPVTIMITVR